MQFSTRTVTNLSLLTAVSIVLTRVFAVAVPISGHTVLRLSFGEIPVMLAGVLFGPLPGALTGAAADLIGYFINPFGGPFFPGFTISAALTGLLAGLMLGRAKSYTWKQMGMMVAVNDLLTSVVLNTIWLVMLYQLDARIVLPTRIAARLVTIPIYTVVLVLIAQAYRKYSR
ncbi:MAG TPA: folate family ECF transporter S component [Firmicutes bacterium]|jgi:ECF transporter S component (folate family)|nr:MAG: hypothetical protein AA931_01695 [Peptococcaceae bacterium 1109]HHT72773.1 folate family ECF transporter S component [Bacillota bacterium]